MFHCKLKYGIILSLLILALILAIIFNFSAKSDEFQVIFLDVGQGDSILISEGDYQMLIDGGRKGKIMLEKIGRYIPFWDRKIEIMLATHPDQDHVSGLIDVLERYKVETIIKTEDKSESQTFKRFENDVDNENAGIVNAKKGVIVRFPSGALAEILYPFSETGDIVDNQSNNGSIVVKIVYGENSFLLTGDLSKDQEIRIINSSLDIKANVLKIGHHGSKYSTSPEFLKRVSPRDAIISVGQDNQYGHPNEEVINLLKERNINILRTDERGDVVYNCQIDSPCNAR